MPEDDPDDDEADERPTPLLSYIERQERAERLLAEVRADVRLMLALVGVAIVVGLLTLAVAVVLLLARH